MDTTISFSFSDHPAMNWAKYAQEHGIELALATAATHAFAQAERLGLLTQARNEIDDCESISRYAADAAVRGISELIETTRIRFASHYEVYLDCRTMASQQKQLPSRWSQQAERSMTANYGSEWQRCKIWVEAGAMAPDPV